MRYIILCTIAVLSCLPAQTQVIICDFSYPPVVCGSSWGLIFQRFYKNGDIESMIKLTSDESILKYGRENISKYYYNMSFGYKIKLKSWRRENNYFILNYEAKIVATDVIIRMKLCQGDTAKIVLPKDFKAYQYFLYK
ncbi:MAG: hypothetical protein NTV09_13065 [Bacteroidetes bacterium]|nr:hypothetical protein [Bacteroidota bacterium]